MQEADGCASVDVSGLYIVGKGRPGGRERREEGGQVGEVGSDKGEGLGFST